MTRNCQTPTLYPSPHRMGRGTFPWGWFTPGAPKAFGLAQGYSQAIANGISVNSLRSQDAPIL